MYNDDLPWMTKSTKPENNDGDVYEQALTAIYQAMKFHNPKDLLGITPNDLKDLVASLKVDYSPSVVMRAKDETLKACTGKALTIGAFLERCMAINRLEATLAKTQDLIKRDDKNYKSIAEENVTRIKQILKAVTEKPLPYDKNIRVGKEARPFSHEVNPVPKGTPLRREEELSFFDPIWDQACYSDGPRLYEKCVAVGHIAPVESIKNPELRDLYTKAWTVGLMLEEKTRFNELLAVEQPWSSYRAI